MAETNKIRFTRHAHEKIVFAKRYGFIVDEKKVIDVIRNPTRLDQKDTQYFVVKIIDTKYALRVVYERRKDFILVITFYPVRREQYGL